MSFLLFYLNSNPPETIWPAKLYTELPHHTVITLIGSTMVRNMFWTAGDFISTDFLLQQKVDK